MLIILIGICIILICFIIYNRFTSEYFTEYSFSNFKYYDENNNLIENLKYELSEQIMADKYIKPNDVVLEIGARYGTVSCVISNKLLNKLNLVIVEPDSKVWDALEKNMKNNNCMSNIVKGFISNKKMSLEGNGYGMTSVEDNNSTIPSYTLDQIKNKYNIQKFNVLVADCEGYLETFLNENPELYKTLDLILFEKDYPEKCNYDNIINKLKENSFTLIEDGFHAAWGKNRE